MHYKAVKAKVIKKYVISLGFTYVGGKSHDKYILEQNGKTYTVIIPRHVGVTPGVVDSIASLLVNDCGFDKSDVKKNLR